MTGTPEPFLESAPGPAPIERSPTDLCFYERARIGALACGVTRLADITGLDRLGLPVWQAIRPAGRALSVHQGKGTTPLAARIGALCEAIESHSAESAPADGPLCAWAELPANARAPEISDYGRTREAVDEVAGVVRWCAATDIVSDVEHFLPFDLVSLDFTGVAQSPFDQSSAGLAVGRTERDAVVTALCELVEHDAMSEWRRTPLIARMAAEIDPLSVPFDWFRAWCDRFDALDILLSIHAPPALAGMPVFTCAIAGRGEFGIGRRTFAGDGAHADPEIALFRALSEAIQSRLTLIAGARDDILPHHYREEAPALSFDIPPAPPGFAVQSFAEIAPGPGTEETLIAALCREGYDRVVAKRLGAHLEGLAVMKLFVPGFGRRRRRRRRT